MKKVIGDKRQGDSGGDEPMKACVGGPEKWEGRVGKKC